MQIPILTGNTVDARPNVVPSYPYNLMPVIQESGISKGFLRPADGISLLNVAPGPDRGGIIWNNEHLRVMGTKLIRVGEENEIVELADIPGNQTVTLDYSFTRLAIAADEKLFYWDGAFLVEVADPDLGVCLSVAWIDGYFVSTDGGYIITTELNDPTSINPLKYGSAEADPDPIYKIAKVRNELCAIGRHSIEFFDNVGGENFPFQRIEGAQISRGAIGPHAACIYSGTIAFVGGGRNEPVSVYLGANASSQRISTDEIDKTVNALSVLELEQVVVEAISGADANRIYVHLPEKTFMYDQSASQAAQEPIWCVLSSSVDGGSSYRARNFVYNKGRWYVGDPLGSRLGWLNQETGDHWGETVTWRFDTPILHNAGKSAIIHSLELVALTGVINLGLNPKVATQWSRDGVTWSDPRYISVGKIGERAKRLLWLMQGRLDTWRVQRFTGDSVAHCSFLRLEAEMEPMAV